MGVDWIEQGKGANNPKGSFIYIYIKGKEMLKNIFKIMYKKPQ